MLNFGNENYSKKMREDKDLSPLEAVSSFGSAMNDSGLPCHDPIIADGKVHRFYVAGDKSGSLNGWYVFFGMAGKFGSWKMGSSHTWSARGQHLSSEHRARIDDEMRKARSDHKIEKRKEQVIAAQNVRGIWEKASVANAAHPYLVSKAVPPHYLRQVKNALLVPLFDFYGELWNIQTIYANGEKRFHVGGRVSEMFSPIGLSHQAPPSRVVICEGWATGATIHEKLTCPVLCAMNAGNLVSVAKNTREHYPDAHLFIAADNDQRTPGNPGLTKAIEAARIASAALMIPEFPEGVEGTDFNDLAKLGWGRAE